MKKRILSMLLAAIMLLTLVPMSAFADSEKTVTFTVQNWAGKTGSSVVHDETVGTGDGEIGAVMRNFKPSNGQIRGGTSYISDNFYIYNTTKMPGSITGITITANTDDTNKFQNTMYAAVGTDSQSAITETIGCVSSETSDNSLSWTFDAAEGYTYFKLLSDEKFTTGSVTGVVVTVTYSVSDPQKELVSISVDGTPTKTEYTVGESFDPTGLTVQATYSDASTADVTDNAEFTVVPETFAEASDSASIKVTAKVGTVTSSEKTIDNIKVKAPASSSAITNGTPQSGAEKNNGYISIDKTTASEGDTVTVTVNPEDGYQLKSLTAVPEAKTISTIADVLATVEGGFPQGTGNTKEAPENAWVCGSDRYTFVVQSGQNSALSFYYSEYVNPSTGEVTGNATPVLTTTGVTAGENGYTATFNTITLTFNMTDGKLTGIVFSSTNGNSQNNYGGTYTSSAITPADSETITPEKQADGTYQFTMPAYAVTVKAEFEEKAITIADILPDDFPRLDDGFPEDTWTNENGIKIIIVEDGLTELFLSKIDFTSNYCITSKINETTLSKDGNNYSYSNSGVTVTFVMSDNELTNIMVQGLTGDYDGFNGTYKAPHIHSFSYSANANVITAICTDGCDKGYDTNPLTLTLTAPASLVYDGNAKEFTFADGEAAAWTGTGLELPTIIYYQKDAYPWYSPIKYAPTDAGGDYMAQIDVEGKTIGTTFTIDKATPYIKTNPAPSDIIYGKKLADSTLAGGVVQISSTNSTEVTGSFTWTNPDTVPGINDSEVTEYDVTFTPTDTNNYNTVSCKVKIKVNHTHAPVLVNGQAATETAAGFKDYYKCDCGASFEDATGLIPIENLAAWQAQGGNGYIAPLVHSITPVNGQDATDTEAGFKAYYECKSCGKYYEDATGLIPITDLAKWKAEDGNGYLAPLHGTDENHDHICDACGNTLSDCADENKDHKCDYCEKVLSKCKDADKDHKCDICGKQISEHNAILVEGTAATLQSAGHKSYYKCDCGKFFEDATCKVEITDLNAWKAAGGNGYIAKLEEEPTSPQTGDNSHMTLWVMLMALSSMGLCACLVLGKKRKNEQ